MTEIHRDLKEALLERRQLQKVDMHFADLTSRLKKEIKEINLLSKLLKKEEIDLEKLESAGIRALFHKILGDKEKQIEKERQQYLQTALKYNALSKSIDLIEYEKNLLEKKLDRISVVEQRYEHLIKLREKELLGSDTEAGRALLALSKKIDIRHIELKDIDEAIVAGNEALNYVRTLEKQLQKAKNWGQWDTYGNGSGSSWLKHQAVDKAREVLHRVRHSLLNFQKELSDVYEDAYIDINLRMEKIDRFVDIFFDNLITDWIVQQKIKKALDNVLNTKEQVIYALKKLKEEGPLVEAEIANLEAQREQAIVDSAS
ncbi:MAG: hypothetical protein DRI69_04760 [Bacteroidetes bacterium]|nr:MAG: hypothetical protein DRI69_04760 [Bacteroidota bacterium]